MPTPPSGIRGRKIQMSSTLGDWADPDAGTWTDLGTMIEGAEMPEYTTRDFTLASLENIGGGGQMDGEVIMLADAASAAAFATLEGVSGDPDAPILLRVLNIDGSRQTIYGGPEGLLVRDAKSRPFGAEYERRSFMINKVAASPAGAYKTLDVA